MVYWLFVGLYFVTTLCADNGIIPPFASNLVCRERELREDEEFKEFEGVVRRVVKEKRKKNDKEKERKVESLSKNLRRFLYRQYDDQIFSKKEISLTLADADISDAIALIGKSVGFNFLVDPDVKGTVRSASYKNVPLVVVLRTLLQSNRPRLALIKDHGLFRIVRLSNAKEILRELQEQDFECGVVQFSNRHLDAKQKSQMKQIWEGIIGDQYGKQGFYLVFSDVSRQVIFKGKKHHVAQFKKFLRDSDRAVAQVEIEARFVCADKGFEENIGFQWSGIYNRRASIKRGFNLIGGGKPLFDVSNNPQQQTQKSLIDWALNFLPTPDNAAKNLRLPFIFGGNDLNTRRLNLVLNAAENRHEIKTILKPSVLTNDREVAHILVGETIPIETIVEESVEGRLRNVTTAHYKDIGIQLKVQPVVAPDKRSVDLDIFIENSQQTDVVKATQTSYPVIRTTRSQTKVRLRSGQTTMISGLIKDINEMYKTKAPFLGDIPLLGWIFRGRRKVTQDMQLLIFITPTVIG